MQSEAGIHVFTKKILGIHTNTNNLNILNQSIHSPSLFSARHKLLRVVL